MNKKNKNFLGFLGSVLLIFSAAFPLFAAGNARLYLEGPKISVAPESNFDLQIFLSSSQLTNALSFELTYPKDKLEFVGFSNASSIVDLWQFQPKVLANGNIGFSGGMIRGWLGSSGLVGAASFKVLGGEEARVSFSKNEVYLADGKATKVVPNTNNFNLSINKEAAKISLPLPETIDTTPPEISFSVVKNPTDGVSLIIFNSSDKESGIKNVQMRYKKWWSYGEWAVVESPVVYPDGAWRVELQFANNDGGVKNETFSSSGILVSRIIYSLLPLFLLVYVVRSVYNKWKRKQKAI